MRGLALICIVASLLAGCTTRQRIAGGGAGLAAIGVALTFSNENRSEEEAEDTAGKVGIACLLTGLVVLFVAAALDEKDKESKAKEIKVSSQTTATPEPSATAVAKKKRDEAAELTKQAQVAAAAGDCAKVTELSAQVGALDAAFYGEVFLQDVAVQKCFVPSEPADAPVPAPAVPVPAVTPVLTPVSP